MKARYFLIALAACLFGSSTFADWKAVKLSSRAYGCQDSASGVVFDKIPYNTTQANATKSCKVVAPFLTWFSSLAEAQQVAILPGVVRAPPATPNTPPPSLHSPWLECDVGMVPTPGVATNFAGTMTVSGSGDVSNGGVLVTHIAYQPWTGNVDFVTRVRSITGTIDYRKAGILFTAGNPCSAPGQWVTGSANVETNSTQQGVAFNLSNIVNGRSEKYYTAAGPQSPPQGLRMAYDGAIASFYFGSPGSWTLVDSETRTFTGTYYVAVFTSSGGPTNPELATALFDEPTITTPAGDPGSITLTQSTQTVIENAGSFTVCATRGVGTSGAASAVVHNAGTGTATGSDWTAADLDQNLLWASGEGGQKCTTGIHVTNRAGTQGSRTLNLELNTFGGAAAGAQITQVVTIVDAITVTSAKRWHPGYYATADRNSQTTFTQSQRFALYDQETNTDFAGWHYFAPWNVLEGDTQGNYTAGDAMLLAEIAHLKNLAKPKRFILQLNDESRNSYPAYMSATCVAQDQPSGQLILYHFKYWDSTCVNFLVALIQHLGTLLDNEPYFEGFIPEYEQALTSATVNNQNGSGFDRTAFYNGVTRVMQAAAAAFPHTNVWWRANWGVTFHEADVAQLLSIAKTNHIGWGDQDACALDPVTLQPFSDGRMPSYIDADNIFAGYGGYDGGHAPGLYTDQRGKMPSFFGVEDSELGYNSVCDVGGGTGTFFNSNYYSLFNWFNDSVHASHVNFDRNVWVGIPPQRWIVGQTNSLWDMALNHPLTHTACPTDYDTAFGNGSAGSGCNTN